MYGDIPPLLFNKFVTQTETLVISCLSNGVRIAHFSFNVVKMGGGERIQ
jgi:hypothetical protein